MIERFDGPGETTDRILQQAAALHHAGKPGEAERLYRKILARDPDHFDATHLLGLARAAQGDIEGGIALIEKALAIEPGSAPGIYNLASLKRQQGHEREALDGFLHAAALAPDYVPARFAAATMLHKRGRLDEALTHYRDGLAREPDNAPARLNLALALRALGALDEAESVLTQALRRRPDDLDSLLQLGDLVAQRGRWGEARAIFEHCRDLAPGSAAAFLGLAGALRGLGDLDGAIAALRQALAAEPDRPATYRALAVLLDEAGALAEALDLLMRAVERLPGDPSVLRALAGTAARAGQARAMLDAYGRLLYLAAATAEDWAAFADAVRLLRFDAYDRGVGDLMLAALQRAGVDWQNLALPVASLVMAMPNAAPLKELAEREAAGSATGPSGEPAIDLGPLAALFDEPLFVALLEQAVIVDVDLELALTALRRSFLARLHDDPPAGGLAREWERFAFALAEQCFLNEYAFFESAAETEQVEALTAALTTPRHPLAECPAAWAALAAYRPLADCTPVAERLSEMEGSAGGRLAGLLARQVRGPLDERARRDAISTLTPIGDRVSQAVQAQYEESPYPRWRALKRLPPRPFAAVLQALLPHLPKVRAPELAAPRILVAGCGTGRHALMTAQLFAGCEVLAIDLSRASLAYAEAGRAAAGIANVRFAQADILELGDDLGLFDLIESSGVLHHMRDPLQGWRCLTSRLASGGVMKVALYSQAARRGVVAVRERLAEKGFDASPGSIRQARRYILTHADDPAMAKVAAGPDFFSLSSCRDLLFHVAETRFTIPQLAAAAADLDLEFLGFEAQDPRLQEAFKEMHPDAADLRSWDAWAAFEDRHPDSFAEMYHIWLARKPES
jgi:tetratricopeptide (TPR) repeat protein/SAM-dependent methyltransferase